MTNWKGFLLAGCTALGLGIAVACGSSSPAGINCGDGSQNCNGTCTVVARDSANCGACGTACQAGQVCSQGACASACGGGTNKCGNECVDTKSDPRNCGTCGKACAANEVCMAGACATSCAMGTMKCGAACVDAMNDRTNCGSCGTTCKAGEICSAGKCAISCQQGLTVCNWATLEAGVPEAGPWDGGIPWDAGDAGLQFGGDFCTDLRTDSYNCGACGNICNAGQRCVSGACKYPTHVGQYSLGAGPLWSNNNTVPYTCQEACAIVYGGTPTDFECSTVANAVNNKAFVDCWGDTANCSGTGVSESYKKGAITNCGASDCYCSAYVNDHTGTCTSPNHCWKYQ